MIVPVSNPEPAKGMCACGQPLHYIDLQKERIVNKLIAELGEFIDVTLNRKDGSNLTYLIPRHYIALHGIKGADLPYLGFKLKEQ